MTRQAFTVRMGQPRDALAILELWQVARTAHASTADRLEDLQRLLASTPGSLIVADSDGAVLGALIAAWDGWRGNMYRLAVLAQHRRRGIGLALVRAGEDHLRDQGAHRITALVGYEDSAAAAFWDCAGYPQDQKIGRRVRDLP